jgi:hypothetical protein
VAAPPAPRRTPVRERGYANSTGTSTSNWWDVVDEETPDLVWPLSVSVYDRMRRTDAQVASVLRAITSPIVRTQWRLDGAGCDEQVTRFVADNLGLPIVGDDEPNTTQAKLRGRDRFSWEAHLRLALLMVTFGHSFFEQVYRETEPDEFGDYKLKKLGPRLPRTIADINVARDGGLVSVVQWGPALGGSLGGGVTLPVNRLVAYVMDREGGNWVGQSLLRPAYKHWLLKDRSLRTWSQSIDRNGIGVPFYTAAENEETLDNGLTLATAVRAGDNSGGAMPSGAKMEMKGVDGTLPDINIFVRYQDEQIARAALGHLLNLGSQGGGQVGSYALGATFQDVLTLGIESIAGEVRDTANPHIVEDLVDLNFGPTEPAPQIVFDPIGVKTSELDRARDAAGLTSDVALLKFLRSIPDQTEEAS